MCIYIASWYILFCFYVASILHTNIASQCSFFQFMRSTEACMSSDDWVAVFESESISFRHFNANTVVSFDTLLGWEREVKGLVMLL